MLRFAALTGPAAVSNAARDHAGASREVNSATFALIGARERLLACARQDPTLRDASRVLHGRANSESFAPIVLSLLRAPVRGQERLVELCVALTLVHGFRRFLPGKQDLLAGKELLNDLWPRSRVITESSSSRRNFLHGDSHGNLDFSSCDSAPEMHT
ncbi:hypothetical protein Q5P01_020016 [Channa striata]|uniref:Uncharacterized protein n=1 Tax=Channa striata TaxID=64152 RepID=A0AA88S0N6_CHASR|nr:hypothetical protein Q5P01_020016 [Channa striata]